MPPMTATFRLSSFVLAAALLAACSTTDSRIRDKQVVFDQLPPQAQQQIRAGTRHGSPGESDTAIVFCPGKHVMPPRRYR